MSQEFGTEIPPWGGGGEMPGPGYINSWFSRSQDPLLTVEFAYFIAALERDTNSRRLFQAQDGTRRRKN
jgi:hypothetical protein